MKKLYFKKYILIVALVFVVSATSVLAAEVYHPLEPGAFGGISTGNSTQNLAGFLGQVFNWGIAIAVVLALIMIIVGGIQYMTTDSFSGKDEGKARIKDALTGLFLALVSYLILFTINPCLVDFLARNECKVANSLLTGTTQNNNGGVPGNIPAGSNSNANKGTATCPPGTTCTTGGVKTN